MFETLPYDEHDLCVHLDPWFWRNSARRPHWWLAQLAAIAALRACAGLSADEIAAIRRRGGDYDAGTATLRVRGAAARTLPVLAALAAVLERALDASPHRDAEFMFTAFRGGPMAVRGVLANMRAHAERNGYPDASARWHCTFVDAALVGPGDDGCCEALRGLIPPDPRRPAPSIDRLKKRLAWHPLAPYRKSTLFERFQDVAPLAAEIQALKARRSLSLKDRAAIKRRHLPEVHRLWRDNWFDAERAAHFFGVARSVFDRWIAGREGRGRAGPKVAETTRTLVFAEYDEARFPNWEKFHRHLVDRHAFPHDLAVLDRILRARGFARPAPPVAADQREVAVATCRGGGFRTWQELHRHLADRKAFPHDLRTLTDLLRSEGLSPPDAGLPPHTCTLVLNHFDEARWPDWRGFHAYLRREHKFPHRYSLLAEFLVRHGFARPGKSVDPDVRALVLQNYDEMRFPSWARFHCHMTDGFEGFPLARKELEALLRDEGFVPPGGRPTEAMRRLAFEEFAKGGFDDWGALHDRLVGMGFHHGWQALARLLRDAGRAPPAPGRLDPEWRIKALAAFDAAKPRSYLSFHDRLAALGFPYGHDALRDFLRSENRVLAPRSRLSAAAGRTVLENYDPSRFDDWRDFHRQLTEHCGFSHEYYVLLEFAKTKKLPAPQRQPVSFAWRRRVLEIFDKMKPESYTKLHRHLKALGFPHHRGAMQEFLEANGRVLRYAERFEGAWKDNLVASARARPIANLREFYRSADPPISYAALRNLLIRSGIEIPRRGPGKGAGADA